MTDDQHPQNHPPNPQNPKMVRGETIGGFKPNYPNPPEAKNPDPTTLREQWNYATRQYGKWYRHAWGTAILAGISFFAPGWVIKDGNPIPSFHPNDNASTD